MTALRQRIFDDEEVVAAGVSFDKRNHDLFYCASASYAAWTFVTSVVQEQVDRIDKCGRTAGPSCIKLSVL
jgi:hypothetical protein